LRKPSATALIAAAAAVIGLYALTTTNVAAETPFAALTPGGQSIARALHSAQLFPDSASGIDLDSIAVLKADASGWGPVFDQMKARGLIAGRSLGLVILGPRRVAASRAWASKSRAIVVTNAMGRQVSFFRAPLRRQALRLPLRALAGR
jgi:hypothetical protein